MLLQDIVFGSGDWVKIVAVGISALSTLVGFGTSGLSEVLLRAFTGKEKLADGTAPDVVEPRASGEATALLPRFSLAKRQVLVRLDDAKRAAARQNRLAKLARWSANSLTFGQYIIGGVMATSFAQKSLSPEVVGIFGVLVVASSLVKQHYHPEINAQSAMQKAHQLESLIRQSEDRLVIIEANRAHGEDNPALLLELLEKISADLTVVSTPQGEELKPAKAPSMKTAKK